MIEKHADRTSAALAQLKELTEAMTHVKDRVELVELQHIDLSKKLDIVEHILAKPEQEKLVQMSEMEEKLQAMQTQIDLLKSEKSKTHPYSS